ncbi:MAG: hypothetical protein JWO19_357 [Bryobacterales bacterium]|nr:hypothetical protein [Bryobacterales bacterium]
MNVLANLVIILHLAYFVFVVGGFLGIVIGAALGWRWVRNPWFRIAHLLSVLIVLLEDVFDVNCPLNVLETSLRSPGTEAVEASGGMGDLLDQLLHHTLSERVLDGLYWTLGPLLVLLFVFVRPDFRAGSYGSK